MIKNLLIGIYTHPFQRKTEKKHLNGPLRDADEPEIWTLTEISVSFRKVVYRGIFVDSGMGFVQFRLAAE